MRDGRGSAWLVLGLLLFGCGARSTLEAADNAAAAGGSGAAASGSAGRAGSGSGGASQPPEVTFRKAEYRDCPTYFEGQGVLCWDLDEGARACLCTVQCAGGGVATTCANVTDSGTAECVQPSRGETGTCLLSCSERRPCPDSMSCVRYPSLTREVCMYVN